MSVKTDSETVVSTTPDKIEELGSVQTLTHKIFEVFLAEKQMKPGENKISSTDLYIQFIAYLEAKQYSIRPSNRAFGRAATARLPYVRQIKGTHYLINQ